MIRKRSFETLSGQRGWFWVSGVWGWICNSVLVIWGSFACVVYSFPFVYPVTAGNMSEFGTFIFSPLFFQALLIEIAWQITSRLSSVSSSCRPLYIGFLPGGKYSKEQYKRLGYLLKLPFLEGSAINISFNSILLPKIAVR